MAYSFFLNCYKHIYKSQNITQQFSHNEFYKPRLSHLNSRSNRLSLYKTTCRFSLVRFIRLVSNDAHTDIRTDSNIKTLFGVIGEGP